VMLSVLLSDDWTKSSLPSSKRLTIGLLIVKNLFLLYYVFGKKTFFSTDLENKLN